MKFATCFALLAPWTSASAIPSSHGAALSEDRVSYDGYHVYRVALDSAPATLLKERLKSFHAIHTRDHVEVAVPPSEVAGFEGLGLRAELINDDLGRDIAAEASSSVSWRPSPLRRRGDLPDLSWFDAYHPYDDHLQYWADLQAAFPDNSGLFDLGPSYEGRRIFGLQLWGDRAGNASKPIILWHATVHAREWISTLVGISQEPAGTPPPLHTVRNIHLKGLPNRKTRRSSSI